MFDAPKILAFLHSAVASGERACLVTVTDVTGASVRNPGAHMAVTETGEYRGSLSGGCIERAVVAEARKAIEAGAPHTIAYGAGTPIIDIRLPCGGRVDLLFTPIDSVDVIEGLIGQLRSRCPAILSLPTRSGELELAEVGETGWNGESFVVRHHPPLRIAIVGHGGTVEALVRQAAALDIACHVATPDRDIAKVLEGTHSSVEILQRVGQELGVALDAWTAVAFFFHDHDWETELLAQVLRTRAFYVGAMGSKATHSARQELLEDIGVATGEIARITAPIGLIPSSRDPETLALSALSQIVDRYNAVIGAQFNRVRA